MARAAQFGFQELHDRPSFVDWGSGQVECCHCCVVDPQVFVCISKKYPIPLLILERLHTFVVEESLPCSVHHEIRLLEYVTTEVHSNISLVLLLLGFGHVISVVPKLDVHSKVFPSLHYFIWTSSRSRVDRDHDVVERQDKVMVCKPFNEKVVVIHHQQTSCDGIIRVPARVVSDFRGMGSGTCSNLGICSNLLVGDVSWCC